MNNVTPLSLKDTPALIEKLLPVQRLSIDVYKERMAGSGQTLTALGSYWKGRKPLVLNRACVLASLLPATDDPKKDLEVFEMLMSMDEESIRKRLGLSSGAAIPDVPYRVIASKAFRAEEIFDKVHTHIWDKVNAHLGTSAKSYSQLVEQLGIMRFGRRPVVADTFSGSGQIPFAAAQIGCDVYASDLNPVSCMLTWAAFNVVGASESNRQTIERDQQRMIASIHAEMNALNVESDGNGWKPKVFLYCIETICPTSGWKVPVLPTLVLSKAKKVVVKLIPDVANKRYSIEVKKDASAEELQAAENGTYQDQFLVHIVDGMPHRNKLSSIRGDATETVDGERVSTNRLRLWDKTDVAFRDDDIYNERLYAIQWIKDNGSARPPTEFRTVTKADLEREAKVTSYVQTNIADWQDKGWIPDMRIEKGDETERLYKERGWTHWHHLFNPRQLLACMLVRKHGKDHSMIFLGGMLNNNARLSRWAPAREYVSEVYDNQALNTIFNYATQSVDRCLRYFKTKRFQTAPVAITPKIINSPAADIDYEADLFITDPPYGDAVKYEEILEFFIAWLRKNPPQDFAQWVWDSRRALAIKGEDHDFKLSMIAAYKRMAEKMPDNGLQIVMFTHQSSTIWADMANIVWASGLQVSAAWYLVTETESALRDGQYVKGTILLVLRKRLSNLETFRDDLAYELEEEVQKQVEMLTGLNQSMKSACRTENLFEDADLQMAGYAAALRVLTKYSEIDGVQMTEEARRPRSNGQQTMVDDLIAFAVNKANEFLVPQGIAKETWNKLKGIERFYIKMIEMEASGAHTLSNYQNFAKAFKAVDYTAAMAETKANKASLKTAIQLGKRLMASTDEFGPTPLRAVLYAIYLLEEGRTSSDDVLHQLRSLVANYYDSRAHLIALADYLYQKTKSSRPEESVNAMILRDLIKNEKV